MFVCCRWPEHDLSLREGVVSHVIITAMATILTGASGTLIAVSFRRGIGSHIIAPSVDARLSENSITWDDLRLAAKRVRNELGKHVVHTRHGSCGVGGP